MQLLEGMMAEDEARLERTKVAAGELRSIAGKCVSSVRYPIKLAYPLFEARAAYAMPNNYFQALVLGSEKLGNTFAHGAMRSLFFAGSRLMLLSKGVAHKDGREFFTHFVLLHLEKGEYEAKMSGEGFRISARARKMMLDLLTGGKSEMEVRFSFIHQDTVGKLVSKEQVMQDSRIKEVYKRFGGARARAASVDMEGYAVTVPHFSPHPYMLQTHKGFGFEGNEDFQAHVPDYFKEHLGS